MYIKILDLLTQKDFWEIINSFIRIWTHSFRSTVFTAWRQADQRNSCLGYESLVLTRESPAFNPVDLGIPTDLMLKILLPLVIENPFTCMLWFEFFFSVLEKLRSCCLIETSQSSKYCLAKDISKPLSICTITQTVKVSVISNGIHWNLWQNVTN